MSTRDANPPRLSRRFERAAKFAARLHRHQTRKGCDTPYISHLLAVAAIVIENGANEDEAIAALLHDAVEDQGGKPTGDEIERRFGTVVRAIVDACSDTDVVPKPPWRKRKEAYIEHLKGLDSRFGREQSAAAPASGDDPGRTGSTGLAASIRLVSMADKLHNARSIIADHRVIGDDVWKRFTASREESLWYYRALVDVFRATDTRPIVAELERTVAELEMLGCARTHNAG